jgi:hypothetical protein
MPKETKGVANITSQLYRKRNHKTSKDAFNEEVDLGANINFNSNGALTA